MAKVLINWVLCGACGWTAYPDLSQHRLPVADNHKPTARPTTAGEVSEHG